MIVNVPKETNYLSNVTYSSNGCPQMVYSTTTNMYDILHVYGISFMSTNYASVTDKFWSRERFIQFLENLPGKVFVQPTDSGHACNIVFQRPEDQIAYQNVRERYNFDLRTSIKDDVDEVKEWLEKISYDRKEISSSVSGISKIVFRDHEDAVAFKLKFTEIVREL